MITTAVEPTYLIFATDAAGEDASFEERGATLSEAHARADERLIGTSVRLDPLPAACPVRQALRKLDLAYRGVRGAGALWDAEDQLCHDPDPARLWLENEVRYRRDLVEHAGALAKAALALATAAAAAP